MRLLLDRGVNINVTGRPCHDTVLGEAVSGGNPAVVTLLLDRGADVNFTSHVHGSALGAAASRGNLEIVTFLLDRGADIISLAFFMVLP